MAQTQHNPNGPKIIGQAYKDLKKIVKKFAQNDYAILLIGEPGTGKELFADLYMKNSNREGTKIVHNCASTSDNLLESEIFGHEKGAFTGAELDRPGKLSRCSNGILFLDELGDASEKFQAAILRVVEQHSYSKVGADKEIDNVNTLIIAATNKPQSLRQDLKDRFHLLFVPPLQKIDIPKLVKHFTKKHLKTKYLKELLTRDYPGNVRELKRVCEQHKAINGKKIFCEKSGYTEPTYNIFDYDRFCREYEIWLKYIQPIIAMTPTGGIRYKYTDPGVVKGQQGHRDDLIIDEEYLHTLADDILNKISGASSKSPESIISRIEWCINASHLPLLFSSIEAHKEGDDHLALTPTTKLLDLLQITSPKDAEVQFLKTYFEYHLRKHNGNRKKTATALGLNPSTFQTKLRKSGIKKRK